VAPLGFIPALLVSLEPVDAATSRETTDPTPHPDDELITRHALEKSWLVAMASGAGMAAARAGAAAATTSATNTPAHFEPRALIIRTLPNPPDKQHQNYGDSTPPYLTREAAELLIEHGIEHLVVDLPSIDRAHDEGRLTAHRIFFGLPPGSTTLARATRARATVTELAYIPDAATDGPYLLELQVPALGGDAVPSRPLLYRLS
jgi:hypothetical protein